MEQLGPGKDYVVNLRRGFALEVAFIASLSFSILASTQNANPSLCGKSSDPSVRSLPAPSFAGQRRKPDFFLSLLLPQYTGASTGSHSALCF
jgi:hypothetical protein